jgi:hypothetical protein
MGVYIVIRISKSSNNMLKYNHGLYNIVEYLVKRVSIEEHI